jgi:hypothetical protein
MRRLEGSRKVCDTTELIESDETYEKNERFIDADQLLKKNNDNRIN